METPPRLCMATTAAAALLTLAACSPSPEAESSEAEEPSQTPTATEIQEPSAATEATPATVEESETFDTFGVVVMAGMMVGGSDGSQGGDEFCMHLTADKRFADDDQIVLEDATGTVVGVGSPGTFSLTEEEDSNGNTIRGCLANFIIPDVPVGTYSTLSIGDVVSDLISQDEWDEGYVWEY